MYQLAKVHDLSEDYPDFKILAMHNEDESSEVATQVEDLTNKKLRYGDFKVEEGYLINEENKLIIVDREKHLEDLHLFKIIDFYVEFTQSAIDNGFDYYEDINKELTKKATNAPATVEYHIQ